jgi:hypothetical protein
VPSRRADRGGLAGWQQRRVIDFIEEHAAGGKLVAMYGTIAEGPGAMVIFEADPAVAPAVAAVAASSDGVTNVRLQRLLSGDEVRAARQKRVELQNSYRPPGQ